MSLYDPNTVPECQGVGVAVGVAVAVTVGVGVAVGAGIIAATLSDQSVTPSPVRTCAGPCRRRLSLPQHPCACRSYPSDYHPQSSNNCTYTRFSFWKSFGVFAVFCSQSTPFFFSVSPDTCPSNNLVVLHRVCPAKLNRFLCFAYPVSVHFIAQSLCVGNTSK